MIDMTRRDFLRNFGAGVGGMVAVSALPSFGEDRPELFPARGWWERLSIVSQHIDAGAEKPFSILHISDTHLTAAYPHEGEWVRKQAEKRTRTFGGRQEEALRDSLAWAKDHVDYVVHTGDMIDFQSEANFDLARKYYGESAVGIAGCLGNHEFYHGQKRDRENEAGKGETRGKVEAAYPFDISLQSSVVNGVNFVAVDNVYNTVTAEQATRFEAEIKKGLPTILCMHCPVATPAISRASAKFWRRDAPKAVPGTSGWKERHKDGVTADFVKYLKAQPLLKAILAGHLHISVCDRFSPTALEFLVGGNFLFHGQEITIS